MQIIGCCRAIYGPADAGGNPRGPSSKKTIFCPIYFKPSKICRKANVDPPWPAKGKGGNRQR